MFSKLELFTKTCAKLDKQGIVMHEKRCLLRRHIHSSCTLCSSVCPNRAITTAEGLNFVAEKCTGCGACTAVCPSGALSAKLPSNQELRTLVRLHIKHSGAVAFACEAYLKAHPAERRRAIAVQCIARCDQSIFIGAVLQGAASVSVLNAACIECPQHEVLKLVQQMADTANWLLDAWEYPAVITLTLDIPERIRPLPVTEGQAVGMSRRAFFSAFKKNSESLVTEVLPKVITGTADKHPENPNPMEEPKYLPDKWSSLVNSLKQLQSIKNDKKFQSSLWGDIKIVGSCNGCGTCAKACPTAALDITEQDGLCSILFAASRCTKCGLCKDVCVSKSIEILPTVSLDIVLNQAPRVLIEKKQAEVDSLLEPVEERMARLLGCVIRN